MLLKTKDLRDKSVEELKDELESLRNGLFEARMSYHARTLENPASLSQFKKSVARVITLISEKEQEANA